MFRLTILFALLTLAACASAPQHSGTSARDQDAVGEVVKITAGEGGAYYWDGYYWPLAELQPALAAKNRGTSIVEIHLYGDELSTVNIAEIGRLAKMLGVNAYYDDGGELKSIPIAND